MSGSGSVRLERYEPMVQSVYDGAMPNSTQECPQVCECLQVINASLQTETHILTGGSLSKLRARRCSRVCSARSVSALKVRKGDPYVLPEDLTNRRLGLAKWIADARNPLTTRSIVNRLWQYHFGKPIAGTPNNFGVKGAKPTHPELLDWLAADFVEHGWTMKRMHKLIMMSQAYQMATGHPQMDKLKNDDPNNELLAYFPNRRLTAEEMRDAMLHITGELNPALGGLPIMPEMNMEVALQPRMIQFSLAPAFQPSPTPAERNRRSIYAYRVRGQADPFLEVFNQPNPNDSCDLRDSASVSPQAFTMMNSDLITDRAIAFALRVQKETQTPEAQINRSFQLALGRSPSAAEIEAPDHLSRRNAAVSSRRAAKAGDVSHAHHALTGRGVLRQDLRV